MCFNFLELKIEMPIDNSILSLYFLSLPSVFFAAYYFPIVTNYKAPVYKTQVRTENLEFIEFETTLVHTGQPGLKRDPVFTPVPPTHTHYKEEVKFTFSNGKIRCTAYSQLSTYHKTL